MMDHKSLHLLTLLYIFLSKVERIVTIAYLSLVKIDRALSRNLADFEAYWVALQDIKALAFDHNLIIKEALVYIRQYVEINPSALFDLLPRKFTASQLRTLYELIYGKPIDVRNFHKKIARFRLSARSIFTNDRKQL